MAKLVENTFRFVNISFVSNCSGMGGEGIRRERGGVPGRAPERGA
jgi:hypothetical protein